MVPSFMNIFSFVTALTGSSSREEQPEQLTPENRSDLLQKCNMTHPLPQNTSSNTVCQAEKPDGTTPRPKAGFRDTDLKFYKDEPKRTNRNLTAAKLSLNEAAETRRQVPRSKPSPFLGRRKELLRMLGPPPTDADTVSEPTINTTPAKGVQKSKLSQLFERMRKKLVKPGFLTEDKPIKTKSVQVTMNGHQVDMVIDKGCEHSIISLDQWQKLDEPDLTPFTKITLVMAKRTGKFKEHVKLDELVGFFYPFVELEGESFTTPIYVSAGYKAMPNFLGRRHFHNLRLHKENAHLIKITRTTGNETPPQTPTNKSDVGPKTVLDLTGSMINYLGLRIEMAKHKNNENREDYEQYMSQTIMDIMVAFETKRADSQNEFEPLVIELEEPDSIDNLRKTFSELKNIYENDRRRSCEVIRDAEDELNNKKNKLASASSEVERAELTELVQRREKALQVIVENENMDFEKKMAEVAFAKEMFPKPKAENKGKKFFKGLKTMFGHRSSNNEMKAEEEV